MPLNKETNQPTNQPEDILSFKKGGKKTPFLLKSDQTTFFAKIWPDIIKQDCLHTLNSKTHIRQNQFVQLAGTVEYTDCTSAKG